MGPIGAVFAGVIRPAALKAREIFSDAVDRYVGIRTTDEAIAASLHRDPRQFRQVGRAFGWTSCWRLLSRLPHGPNEAFLDIGCGSGRMICAAARRSYARVLGIDLSPEMVAFANRNVATLHGRRAPCQVIHADATTYEVPDDVTVVFLYNPFRGAIFDAAIQRVVESYARRPRRMVIAYANPAEVARLAQWPALRLVRHLQFAWRPGEEWRRTQAVAIYEISPGRSASDSPNIR